MLPAKLIETAFLDDLFDVTDVVRGHGRIETDMSPHVDEAQELDEVCAPGVQATSGCHIWGVSLRG